MSGFWFAATIAALVMAGVVAQLGLQLPEKAEVMRVFRRDRLRSGRPPTRQPGAAAVAEQR
jgi:hypothetical protein